MGRCLCAVVALACCTVGCGDEGGVQADAGVQGDAGDSSLPATQSPGCGASAWEPSGSYTLDVNGTERTYIVSVPASYDPNMPQRLVIAWHGFSLSAAQIAGPSIVANRGEYLGLKPASQDGAIFVAPQGLDTTLIGITGAGWDNMNGRDVAFARALVTSLSAQYCVDTGRVFSVGSSYGGYFSNQIGCEADDVFRAVASIMGGGPLPLAGVTCDRPMAAWIGHGRMDTVNAFTQGEESRDHWTSVNHCATTTSAVTPAPCVAYDGCDPGYPVHWCAFDGGHAIPDFAPPAIWSFLAQF
jgi:polyhydroxybutyrate depolymerase